MTKKADKKEANFNPPLYVFGLDENGKPRGARFSEVRDDIVTAALDMQCWVVYPAPEDFVPLGMKLPAGRLYATEEHSSRIFAATSMTSCLQPRGRMPPFSRKPRLTKLKAQPHRAMPHRRKWPVCRR